MPQSRKDLFYYSHLIITIRKKEFYPTLNELGVHNLETFKQQTVLFLINIVLKILFCKLFFSVTYKTFLTIFLQYQSIMR